MKVLTVTVIFITNPDFNGFGGKDPWWRKHLGTILVVASLLVGGSLLCLVLSLLSYM